jgi:hypothetical protein
MKDKKPKHGKSPSSMLVSPNENHIVDVQGSKDTAAALSDDTQSKLGPDQKKCNKAFL